MPVSAVQEGFSLSHVGILDGSTTFHEAIMGMASVAEDEDIYGVREASIEPSVSDWTNEGDDAQLSIWSWLENAEINVQSGYLSLPAYCRITGQELFTSSLGGSILFEADLWHEDSMNVSPFPMIVVIPSRDKDGAVRRIVVGIYKFQPKPITFEGPSYKDGLTVSYSGTALMSSKDETGAAHSDGKKKVGRLISVF